MQDTKGDGWSKDWIRSLDLATEKDSKKLKLYPLQFANCDRLEANDCVFIFDEVGTGKTISSGLMAMHYLYNNPGKKVLVITTHSVKGQFQDCWESKMPYKELGYDKQVKYIGNHYVNLTNKSKTEYGLIIVDEAQLFLNAGTRKQEALRALKADKVVFLTATPVKEGKSDLEEFVELAEAIVGKEKVTKVRNLLCGNNAWNEERVKEVYKVNSFDETHPITRYFKDTIKKLEFEKKEKTEAIRQQVKEWEFNNQDECYPTLCDEIKKILEEQEELRKLEEKKDPKDQKEIPDSRFIVFTRTKSESIKGSAGELGAYFRENGYQEFDGHEEEKFTYKILDGDAFQDKDAVEAFLKKEKRPTVLILTYQVGEQGLNLAGFDHVINLHISRFPANLEQRYGRIDRLDAEGHQVFKEIYMVFLLQRFGKSSSTENYYEALGTYIRSLLPFFPSKNVLLNEKNMESVKEWFEKELKKTEQVKPEVQQRRLNELAEKQGYYGEGITYFDELLPAEQAELRQILEKEEKKKNRKKEEILKGLEVFMQKLPDGVFYVDPLDVDKNGRPKVKLLGHPNDFGDEIRASQAYQEYCKVFNEEVNYRALEKAYLDRMDKYFSQRFNENDFYSLFPFDGYRRVFEAMLEAEEFQALQGEEKQYFIRNCDSIAKRLPLLCKLRQYGNYWIWKQSKTKNGALRMDGFDYVPFVRALATGTGKKAEEEKQYLDYFNLTYDAEKKQIEASAFYKLAFHFTRREEALLRSGVNDSDWRYCEQEYEENGVKKTENFFYRLELKMKKINSMDEQELTELCKEKRLSLQEYVQLGNLHGEKYRYRTLFYHFFYVKGKKKKLRSLFDRNDEKYSKDYTDHLLRIKTENGYCSLEELLKTEKNVKAADYWTRGIMYNLYGFEWDKNNQPLIWGDLLPNLPEELKNEKVY